MKRFLAKENGDHIYRPSDWAMGLAQIDDPLVMRITFEAVMMQLNVDILHCKSWYLWERNRFIGKLPRSPTVLFEQDFEQRKFEFGGTGCGTQRPPPRHTQTHAHRTLIARTRRVSRSQH